jgi:hypothetical protein
MKKKNFDLDLIKELDELLDLSRGQVKKIKVPVIYDGNQYTLKIPKKIAESSDLKKGDFFEFTSYTEYKENNFKSNLRGKLLKEG